MNDYTFYKIYSNNILVNEIYIGSSKNFINRKSQHKSLSLHLDEKIKKKHIKLY